MVVLLKNKNGFVKLYNASEDTIISHKILIINKETEIAVKEYPKFGRLSDVYIAYVWLGLIMDFCGLQVRVFEQSDGI